MATKTKQTNIFENHMNFKGTFRPYQQRVLDNSHTYLADGRLHIVAAPGSGKTTLGIELITRLGAPCLILTPSITIREQWGGRIASSFLNEEEDATQWISSTIKEPLPITTITYQALHSAYTRHHGPLPADDGEITDDIDTTESEDMDYSDFDLIKTIRDAGIRTICLDEAHHLRSEWWKVLEQVIKELADDITLICLTATPPYDSTPAQWKRYTDLCGPIDEEIFTPELVKAKNLCPHQDYVYFNYPTEEELETVHKFRQNIKDVFAFLRSDAELLSVIRSHKGLTAEKEYSEFFLDRPAYFSSILIYLNAHRVPLSGYLRSLIGTKGKLPELTPEWMEILLQGFLYDDTDSYENSEELREKLTDYLKQHRCIVRKKVTLGEDDSIRKMLLSSKGKLNSIIEITKAEAGALGSSLRELILCDYIKKEYMSAIGDPERTIEDNGVLPIFERLRRENMENIKLGVLCGSVVIIPDSAIGALEYLFVENNTSGKFTPLGDTGYQQVTISGNKSLVVKLITALFEDGQMQIMIGTKSLLGEGWDSPCINTLILASFVGSFMLSNQMRGRAIRVSAKDPGKISNIWHLVCVDDEGKSSDYETLKRRFESFLGVGYDSDRIENGLDRLSVIKEPFTQANIAAMNGEMLALAADRSALKEKWDKAFMTSGKSMAVEEVTELTPAASAPGFVLGSAVAKLVMYLVFLLGLFLLWTAMKKAGLSFLGFIAFAALLIVLFKTFGVGNKVLMLSSPRRRMQAIGKALLKTLKQTGYITSADTRVETKVTRKGNTNTCLTGGTAREKSDFAKALGELFAEIDNPRYLLFAKTLNPLSVFSCMSIPECLGTKKENAQIFHGHLQKVLGKYELVYTRTPEGRKKLLKARTHCLTGRSRSLTTRKKQMHQDYK
ncbi:MAG: DEAD/DEAH box helicase family protein [Lachnospiraceae bacterium]|nr:DEAD/DEAH box helicase family protein [Lachnospiraceae bacterium]